MAFSRRSFFTAWLILGPVFACDTPEDYDFSGLPRPPIADDQHPTTPRETPQIGVSTAPVTTRVGGRPVENKPPPLQETREWRMHREEIVPILANFQFWLANDAWHATLRVGAETATLSSDSALAWVNFLNRSIIRQPGTILITPPPNGPPNKKEPQRGAYELRVADPVYYLTIALDQVEGHVVVNVEGKHVDVFADFLESLPEFSHVTIDRSKRLGTRLIVHEPKPTKPVRNEVPRN